MVLPHRSSRAVARRLTLAAAEMEAVSPKKEGRDVLAVFLLMELDPPGDSVECVPNEHGTAGRAPVEDQHALRSRNEELELGVHDVGEAYEVASRAYRLSAFARSPDHNQLPGGTARRLEVVANVCAVGSPVTPIERATVRLSPSRSS